MEVALVGLAGVVIGAGLTLLSNMFVERQKWGREAQTRWHEVRRELYASFIRECDELQRAAVELTEDSVLGQTGTAHDATLASLGKAEDESTQMFHEITLVGTQPVIDAARAMGLMGVRALGLLGPDSEGTITEKDWVELRDGLIACRNAFLLAARNELEIG